VVKSDRVDVSIFQARRKSDRLNDAIAFQKKRGTNRQQENLAEYIAI
jgi:hypothetical protein